MEQLRDEGTERERTGIARNQHVLYLLPHEAAAIAHFLPPVLERLAGDDSDTASPGPRVLIVTPDAETSVNVARFALQMPAHSADTAAQSVVPVTSARRAARQLAARSVPIVVGDPNVLLELIRGATLKLANVRALVIAWVDAIVDAGATPLLEALMNEIPKDAARTMVAAHATPAVEALVERYARRPRRVTDGEEVTGGPIALRYLVSTSEARPAALRRLLDELDPPSAAVYVYEDATAAHATAALQALGYGDADAVRIAREAPQPAPALLVLYELPPTIDALRALAASGSQLVALAAPRELPALRALAGGGSLVPYTFDALLGAARAHEDRTRDELRGILGDGLPARELLTIEPLLSEFDAASVAAAALKLLERERSRSSTMTAAASIQATTARPAAHASDRSVEAAGASARIFINVGTRDGVSARDLVGAIANEADIPGSRIGRVDVREGHSIVELSAADAAVALDKLTGVTVRGRKLAARLDRDHGPRSEGGPPRGRGRDDRPARGGGAGRGPSRGNSRGTSRGAPRAPRTSPPSRPPGK